MKRTVVLASAVVAGLFASSAASAADLSSFAPVPSFTWTGAYVGVQAGYSWGKSRFNVPAAGLGIGAKPRGFVAGAYAGYNYQFEGSPLVVGVETDFNYADIDDRNDVFFGLLQTKTRTRWTGATRARVGYAVGRTLFYAAGGVAYAKREVRASVPLLGFSTRDTKTSVGWTLGAGVEHAITDNVIARVEYRYTDYGKDTFNLGGVKVRGGSNHEHRVMAGLAFKF